MKALLVLLALVTAVASIVFGFRTISEYYEEEVPQAPAGSEVEFPGMGLPAAVTRNDFIIVRAPTPRVPILSPVTITGDARTFEGNVQFRIRDGRGNILAETFTTALMPDVGKFGPFSRIVRYQKPAEDTGTIDVFEYSARDGTEVNLLTIPVQFSPQGFRKVQLFFTPVEPGITCDAVVSVIRTVPKGEDMIRAAVEELLEGPTTLDLVRDSVTTSIPVGEKIDILDIQEGIASVSFDPPIGLNEGCRAEAIRAQITETLIVFSEVREVVIVDGSEAEAVP